MEELDFNVLKSAVTQQFNEMSKYNLFSTSVDMVELYDTYLNSFPEGTNNIFRERREHDCNCCKSFIRNIGDIVAIIDGKLVSIWDCTPGGAYQVVVDAMSALVKKSQITNVYLHSEKTVGVNTSIDHASGGQIIWSHFYLPLPNNLYCHKNNIGSKLDEYKTKFNLMYRALTEIEPSSVDTVLELIAQNGLYRGDEHKRTLTKFKNLQSTFRSIDNKELYCWDLIHKVQEYIARIRNTSIGTLLVDLSKGVEIERAVNSFEAMVAPTNYKRPTAIVTKGMIEKAEKTITELGLLDSLDRRYAVIEDLTVNNILFVDRDSAPKLKDSVFDQLHDHVKSIDEVKNYKNIDTVSIDTFINEIIPKVDSIEVLVDNKHINNMVSLISPVKDDSKLLFKWHNNFSWSYVGELTDSIKERVKAAGGNVTGYARFSLSWFNYDDLDLHMKEPGGNTIYYGNKRASPKGNLDVDMNAGLGKTRNGVENICYPTSSNMSEGIYTLLVNNYCKRESIDVGFIVEMEVGGEIKTFNYTKGVRYNEFVQVLKFKYDRVKGIEIIESLPHEEISKSIWGINTNSFVKVKTIMYSPNYWDEKVCGNKHHFFMLDGCINDGTARGFYNEFLSEDLSVHRKVFELLGSKMKVPESNNQLSGLGFSSTKRDELICRVKGSFSRVIKVAF